MFSEGPLLVLSTFTIKDQSKALQKIVKALPMHLRASNSMS